MICTMPECQTTAGCLCRLSGIVTDSSYIAPFVPSLADDYYSKVIAQKDAELDRIGQEAALTHDGWSKAVVEIERLQRELERVRREVEEAKAEVANWRQAFAVGAGIDKEPLS